MDVIPQSYFFQSKSEVTKFKLKFLPSLVRFINKIQRAEPVLSLRRGIITRWKGVGKLGLIHHRHCYRANIHSDKNSLFIYLQPVDISNLSIHQTQLKLEIQNYKSEIQGISKSKHIPPEG